MQKYNMSFCSKFSPFFKTQGRNSFDDFGCAKLFQASTALLRVCTSLALRVLIHQIHYYEFILHFQRRIKVFLCFVAHYIITVYYNYCFFFYCWMSLCKKCNIKKKLFHFKSPFELPPSI